MNFLLQSELPGGGWTLMGSNADSDITGMTLQALAPYYHKSGYENVTAAIDRGLNKLSEMQNDSGGYSTIGCGDRGVLCTDHHGFMQPWD